MTDSVDEPTVGESNALSADDEDDALGAASGSSILAKFRRFER